MALNMPRAEMPGRGTESRSGTELGVLVLQLLPSARAGATEQLVAGYPIRRLSVV